MAKEILSLYQLGYCVDPERERALSNQIDDLVLKLYGLRQADVDSIVDSGQ